MFAAPVDQPRVRRGTDVVLLVPALLALGVAVVSTLSSDLDLPTGDTRVLLWILVGLVAVVLGAALAGPVRRTITGRPRTLWPDVRAALISLRASNKLALLIVGNLAAEVLLAIALGLTARGLGYHVTLAAAGLPPEAALATALAFRIETFYLPPLRDFFALAWPQRARYL